MARVVPSTEQNLRNCLTVDSLWARLATIATDQHGPETGAQQLLIPPVRGPGAGVLLGWYRDKRRAVLTGTSAPPEVPTLPKTRPMALRTAVISTCPRARPPVHAPASNSPDSPDRTLHTFGTRDLRQVVHGQVPPAPVCWADGPRTVASFRMLHVGGFSPLLTDDTVG